MGPLSVGPVSVGPLSVGSGVRRTDAVQRVVTALSSSVRAVRGPVPRSGDVVVLDVADLFAARPSERETTTHSGAARASAEEKRGAVPPGDADELTEALLSGGWTSATRIGRLEAPTDPRAK